MVLWLENIIPEFIRNIGYNPYSDSLKWALLSILLLVILHMFRPKPHDKTVPSIMFFMKEGGKSKRNAFLQRFFNNLLFFIQLFALLLLCFALFEPFIMMNKNVTQENTVLVIDISASMSGVFDEAILKAKENLFGKISIILVSDSPLVALEFGSRTEAISVINELEPKPFGSGLGDSIKSASDLLNEVDGRIVVISDFINTRGSSALSEKLKAEAKGQTVDFINVASPNSNVGIINVKVDGRDAVLYIKNFNSAESSIDVKINEETKKYDIDQRSIISIPLTLIPGMNNIEIQNEDDVMFDNYAYISTPLDDSLPVMLITNVEDKNLVSALEASSDVILTIVEPPIVPDIDHKIVILGEIIPEKLLPGTTKDIEKVVKNGDAAIVMSHSRMKEIDYKNLLPMEVGDYVSTKSVVGSPQSNRLTKDMQFGFTHGYYNVETEDEYFSISTAADNNSVLGYAPLKKGITFYYGINEDDNFLLSPSYPIFWNELLSFLVDSKELDYYNHFTGSVLNLNEDEALVTPDGKVVRDNILFDEPGIYILGDDNLGVNFMDEKESDIFSNIESGRDIKSDITKVGKKKMPQTLTIFAIVLVIILLMIELAYIKYRGDI